MCPTPIRRVCRFVCLLGALVLGGASATAILLPGWHAFTLIAHDTPHVVVASRDDLTVDLRLRNDGQSMWQAGERYALSYHWLSVTGRVVERDGIRTWMPRDVGPGTTIALRARIGAPPSAGVYRLQWDMVEEGVAWFSELDPRPAPRLWVVTLPNATGVVAALVPTTVLLSFAAVAWRWRQWRRGQLSRLPTDLWLCGLVLFTKQLWLMVAAHVPVSGAALLPVVSTSAVPAALLLALPAGRLRAWCAWGVACASTLVILGDALYFRYFGDILSMAAFRAAGQSGYLWASVQHLLAPADLWLSFDLVGLLALAAATPVAGRSVNRVWRRRVLVGAAACLALAVSARPLVARLTTDDSDGLVFRHLNLVGELGPFGYHAADAAGFLRRRVWTSDLSPVERAEVERWFADHAAERAGKGPAFGAARGRNVVTILGESLQGFVIGLRVNGQEITPTLNRLRSESLWTTRLVDQAGEGRTSDAELVNAVSLLPLDHGAAAFHYPANGFVAVPRVLAERGYTTLSAVPFDGGFWNRSVTHAAYGFRRSYFAPDFEPGPRVGWGLNDRDFLVQMVPRLAALPQPFCAWMITLSLHHPFDEFPAELARLDLGRWNGTRLGNYLQAMHLLDIGVGEFVRGMQARGLLENTVLVIEGDHEAGVPWADVAKVAGFHEDELDWYLADRLPLLIRVPGASGPRGEVAVPAGQTDVGPTLLALLGVDPAPFAYVGRNLLGRVTDRPILRRYGDWIDSRHLYLAGRSYTATPTCYELATREKVPVSACADGAREALLQQRVSWQVLTRGLQERLSGPRP